MIPENQSSQILWQLLYIYTIKLKAHQEEYA